LILLGEDHAADNPRKAILLADMVLSAARRPSDFTRYRLHAFELVHSAAQAMLDEWLYSPDHERALLPTWKDDRSQGAFRAYERFFRALKRDSVRRTCVLGLDEDPNKSKQQIRDVRKQGSVSSFRQVLDERDRMLSAEFAKTVNRHNGNVILRHPTWRLPMPVDFYRVRPNLGSCLVGVFHAQRMRGAEVLKGSTFAEQMDRQIDLHSVLLVTANLSDRVRDFSGNEEFALRDAFEGIRSTYVPLDRNGTWGGLARATVRLDNGEEIVFRNSLAEMFDAVVWLSGDQ
ncbi:MAG: hypothetical protein ACRD88_16710, partial [Terriglobia bacterium]